MALTTITGFPLRILLADEDAVLKLQSPDYVETAGAKAKLRITFTDHDTIGNTCAFSKGGNTYPCEVRATDIGDGQDWPNTTGTLAQHVTNIKSYLDLFYWIAKDYTVTAGADYVDIEANDYGAEYDLDFDPDTLSGYDSHSNTVAGADVEGYDFHTVRMNVLWYNKTMGEDNAIHLAEIELPVDANGQVKFNLKGLSKGKHLQVFEWYEYLLLIPRSDMQVKLKLIYSEHHGTPPIPYSNLVEKLLTTIPGGLSREKLAEINEGGSHPILLNATYPRIAATNHPGNKRVFFDSVEKLYFDFFTTPFFSTIKSKIKVQSKSGGYITFYRKVFNNADGHTVFEVSASPWTNNIYQMPLSNILYYEITLVDQNNDAITETYRYYLDLTYYPNKRRFVFLNSLGRYDGLTCVGEHSNTNEYTSNEFIQMVDESFTSADAEIATLDVTEHQTFDCSTGWVDLGTNDWFRDFSLSPERHEIDDYGRRYRIYITSKKIFKHRTKDYLYKMDFSYVRAYKDKFYSKLTVPKEHGANHGDYPRYVNDNITPVLGKVTFDSDEYQSVHWDEDPMEIGMRVLVLDADTQVGEIYVCTEGEPNTLELTGETCPGDRVYDELNDVVYQRNSEGEWLTGPKLLSRSDWDSTETVRGLVPDNVTIQLWHCDTEGGTYTLAGETSDVDDFRENGMVFTSGTLKNYMFLRVIHCVYDFPDSNSAFNVWIWERDLTVVGHCLTTSSSTTNGTEPYTVLWSDAQTSKNIMMINSDTLYSIVVTDNDGNTCSAYITTQ